MKKYILGLISLYCTSTQIQAFNSNELVLADNVIKTTDLMKLSLEDLFDVEIVTASKIEETIFDAPSSVTVFTRQQLLRMGVTSVEELLNFVPGFIANREIVFGQGYMVAARGSTTPQSSYNILFMLDGQRLNNDFRGGALDTYGHFLSLANVKQIEIIRGPGSASYGTGAVTGVVNIITATDINDAFIGASDLNSREGYVNLSRKGDNWSFALFARYFEDKGQTYTQLLNPKLATINDPRQGRDIQLHVNYEKLHLNIRHHQRELDDFYILNFASNDNNNIGEQNFIAFDYTLLDDKRWQLTLEGNYTSIDSDATTGIASQEEILSLPPDITTGRVAALRTSISQETGWTLGVNGRFHLNDQHTFFAGLSWYQPTINESYQMDNYNSERLYSVLSQKNPTQKVDYYDGFVETKLADKSHRDIIGLYLQHKYKPNQDIELTLGARYDDYSDFGGTLNPRAAIVYSFTDKTRFKAMYGEAFRAPAIVQTTGIGLGNPNLNPEKIKTVEFAWLQQHEAIQTTLTYFYSRASDRIDTALVPGTTDRKFTNLPGTLNTAGWEMEASTEWNDLSLRAAYMLLQKTEVNPRRFPKQTFSLIANYHYNDLDINLNTYFHDNVEQQILGGKLIDISSRWVVNTTLRYALANDLTLVGKVNNLLDEKYYDSGKNVLFLEGIPNRGRTYSLGIEMRF